MSRFHILSTRLPSVRVAGWKMVSLIPDCSIYIGLGFSRGLRMSFLSLRLSLTILIGSIAISSFATILPPALVLRTKILNAISQNKFGRELLKQSLPASLVNAGYNQFIVVFKDQSAYVAKIKRELSSTIDDYNLVLESLTPLADLAVSHYLVSYAEGTDLDTLKVELFYNGFIVYKESVRLRTLSLRGLQNSAQAEQRLLRMKGVLSASLMPQSPGDEDIFIRPVRTESEQQYKVFLQYRASKSDVERLIFQAGFQVVPVRDEGQFWILVSARPAEAQQLLKVRGVLGLRLFAPTSKTFLITIEPKTNESGKKIARLVSQLASLGFSVGTHDKNSQTLQVAHDSPNDQLLRQLEQLDGVEGVAEVNVGQACLTSLSNR